MAASPFSNPSDPMEGRSHFRASLNRERHYPSLATTSSLQDHPSQLDEERRRYDEEHELCYHHLWDAEPGERYGNAFGSSSSIIEQRSAGRRYTPTLDSSSSETIFGKTDDDYLQRRSRSIAEAHRNIMSGDAKRRSGNAGGLLSSHPAASASQSYPNPAFSQACLGTPTSGSRSHPVELDGGNPNGQDQTRTVSPHRLRMVLPMYAPTASYSRSERQHERTASRPSSGSRSTSAIYRRPPSAGAPSLQSGTGTADVGRIFVSRCPTSLVRRPSENLPTNEAAPTAKRSFDQRSHDDLCTACIHGPSTSTSDAHKRQDLEQRNAYEASAVERCTSSNSNPLLSPFLSTATSRFAWGGSSVKRHRGRASESRSSLAEGTGAKTHLTPLSSARGQQMCSVWPMSSPHSDFAETSISFPPAIGLLVNSSETTASHTRNESVEIEGSFSSAEEGEGGSLVASSRCSRSHGDAVDVSTQPELDSIAPAHNSLLTDRDSASHSMAVYQEEEEAGQSARLLRFSNEASASGTRGPRAHPASVIPHDELDRQFASLQTQLDQALEDFSRYQANLEHSVNFWPRPFTGESHLLQARHLLQASRDELIIFRDGLLERANPRSSDRYTDTDRSFFTPIPSIYPEDPPTLPLIRTSTPLTPPFAESDGAGIGFLTEDTRPRQGMSSHPPAPPPPHLSSSLPFSDGLDRLNGRRGLHGGAWHRPALGESNRARFARSIRNSRDLTADSAAAAAASSAVDTLRPHLSSNLLLRGRWDGTSTIAGSNAARLREADRGPPLSPGRLASAALVSSSSTNRDRNNPNHSGSRWMTVNIGDDATAQIGSSSESFRRQGWRSSSRTRPAMLSAGSPGLRDEPVDFGSLHSQERAELEEMMTSSNLSNSERLSRTSDREREHLPEDPTSRALNSGVDGDSMSDIWRRFDLESAGSIMTRSTTTSVLGEGLRGGQIHGITRDSGRGETGQRTRSSSRAGSDRDRWEFDLDDVLSSIWIPSSRGSERSRQSRYGSTINASDLSGERRYGLTGWSASEQGISSRREPAEREMLAAQNTVRARSRSRSAAVRGILAAHANEDAAESLPTSRTTELPSQDRPSSAANEYADRFARRSHRWRYRPGGNVAGAVPATSAATRSSASMNVRPLAERDRDPQTSDANASRYGAPTSEGDGLDMMRTALPLRPLFVGGAGPDLFDALPISAGRLRGLPASEDTMRELQVFTYNSRYVLPVKTRSVALKGKGKAKENDTSLLEADEADCASAGSSMGNGSSPSAVSPVAEPSASTRALDSPASSGDRATARDGIVSESPEFCPICLDEYVGDDQLAACWCQHEFHEGCLKTWLRQTNSCPLCRSIEPDDQSRATESLRAAAAAAMAWW